MNIKRKPKQKVDSKPFTRANRKLSTKEQYKSAITEHVAETNHHIAWDKGAVIDRESNKTVRWLKEAIWIRRRGDKTLNKDEGAYGLHSIYDQLLSTPSTSTTNGYKKPVCRGQSCQSEEATRLVVKRN